jgi:hypothetical protein
MDQMNVLYELIQDETTLLDSGLFDLERILMLAG